MFRTTVLAGLLVLVLAGSAEAGPFGRRVRGDCPPQPRFPRLAAIAQPPGFVLPGYQLPRADRRPILGAVPWAVSAALNVMSFFPPPFDTIGLVVGPTVRATHVVLNGSPTPGRPLVTVGWIASAYATEGLLWLRMRRRGIVPGVSYPTNPPLTPATRPFLGPAGSWNVR